jgi:hypothetical protein
MTSNAPRRVLPGFASAGAAGRYRKITPTAHLITKKRWLPSQSTNINSDAVLTFNLKTGPEELIK